MSLTLGKFKLVTVQNRVSLWHIGHLVGVYNTLRDAMAVIRENGGV